MVSRRKILVTGATGFVGSSLVKELRKRDEHVTCLIRNTSRGSELEELGAELVEGDVTHSGDVNSAFKNIDTVIHLAAVIDAPDKELFESVNVDGTKNCVDAAVVNKVRRFIYMSSLDAKFNMGLYSKSKLAAENIVRKSGLDFIILRPSFIYGANSSDLEELTSLVSKHRFIPIIGKGRYTLQPVYIDDVISVIAEAMDTEKTSDRTYYVAGEEEISFDELVAMISDQLGMKRKKVHVPIFLVNPLVYIYEKLSRNPSITLDRVNLLQRDKTCDISDTQRDFTFQPIKFEAGLELALKEYKAQ